MSDKFDIIIVGAGPAGCCCALMLANTGLKLAIIDKSSFPRDKICGDALSFAVLNNLKKLPQGIFDRFLNEFNSKLPSYGVRFVSPSSEILDIDFNSPANSSYAPGYISKREDFDFFLFKELKNYPNINIIQNCRINDVTYSESINLITETNLYSAKIVVAADGANSIIRKKLSGNIIDKNRQCTGIKAYFKGVSGFREGNFIELHFLKDILPGYFWIFPLPNGMANVGLGMLNKDIHKNKTILKKQFTSIISSNTLIAPRFINSELIGNYQADYLPLGTKKYNISGERFLLTGDAACLTDPFTGEGVANAMFSG
nr:geranylgeranyl reductase family protein [Bacteroidales bacterium]